MTCLGVLDRGEQGDDNETGLTKGRRNRNVNYSASIRRSLRFVFTYRDSIQRLRLNLLLRRHRRHL